MQNDQPIGEVDPGQDSPRVVRPSAKTAAFRPGEREFYGGLAAITICCAIAMMRGGPDASYAAAPSIRAQTGAVQSQSTPMAEHANLAERNERDESPSASRVRSLR